MYIYIIHSCLMTILYNLLFTVSVAYDVLPREDCSLTVNIQPYTMYTPWFKKTDNNLLPSNCEDLCLGESFINRLCSIHFEMQNDIKLLFKICYKSNSYVVGKAGSNTIDLGLLSYVLHYENISTTEYKVLEVRNIFYFMYRLKKDNACEYNMLISSTLC